MNLIQGDHVVLGDTYHDTIHHIGGIVIAQCSYFTGCDRILLEWVKDGEIKEGWFDIIRLEFVKARTDEEPVALQPTVTGGPAPQPRASSTPSRRGSA